MAWMVADSSDLQGCFWPGSVCLLLGQSCILNNSLLSSALSFQAQRHTFPPINQKEERKHEVFWLQSAPGALAEPWRRALGVGYPTKG